MYSRIFQLIKILNCHKKKDKSYDPYESLGCNIQKYFPDSDVIVFDFYIPKAKLLVKNIIFFFNTIFPGFDSSDTIFDFYILRTSLSVKSINLFCDISKIFQLGRRLLP